jgi:hypothetical protein
VGKNEVRVCRRCNLLERAAVPHMKRLQREQERKERRPWV